MLCILNIDELDEELSELLREAEKKIFITEKENRGNASSVFGRILLGYMLKKSCGADTFSYRYGEQGKPYFADSDRKFSISHSGKYVMCCLTEKENGCDIEKIKRYNPKIPARFFTEKETLLLSRREDRELLFTKLWTLKESILKKNGTGIAGSLDSFCFADYADRDEFFAYGCYFSSDVCGDYVLSLCSEDPAEKVCTVSKKEIEEYIGKINLKKT